MALRSIEIRKEIDDNRKNLKRIEERISAMQTRETELAEAIENATEETREGVEADVESFTAEKKTAHEDAETLRDAIEALEKELAEIEKNEPSNADGKKERKLDSMENMITRDSHEYVEAYARYIKTGKDNEVRSLLTENVSGGTVAVPSFVDEMVRHAWENNSIMSAVRKTYLKGNVKVGFEISADGAVVHQEGTNAPSEESLSLGIVTMVPANIKKWITISDEALALNGEAFLRYVYEELTYQIAKKASDVLVGMIEDAGSSSTSTACGQPVLTTSTITVGTIAKALAKLSDECTNPCIIMNKATWGKFKEVEYSANYGHDIFEGLEVKFSSALTAFESAEDGDVFAIVGDLGHGAQANFPEGDTIKFVLDELSLAEKDLVKVVGREYVGLGIVAPQAFCRINVPENGDT